MNWLHHAFGRRRLLQAGWAVLLAGVAVFAVRGYQRYHERHLRDVCGAKLHQIGVALLTYADAKQGVKWPASDGYIYVTKPKTNDPREVLAYEPLSKHHGKWAHVLFLDGSVKFLNPSRFQWVMERKWAEDGGGKPAIAP